MLPLKDFRKEETPTLEEVTSDLKTKLRQTKKRYKQ